MDDLLKEAIADAKAVRETALANAKIALEEAFTPKLQSMLSKKIQQEEDGEELEGGEDEEEAPAEDEFGDEEGGEEKEVDIAVGDEVPAEDGDIEGGEEEFADEVPSEEGEYEEDEEGGEEDDLDLEAIIRELEDEEGAEEEPEVEESNDVSSGIGSGDNSQPSAAASDDDTEDSEGESGAPAEAEDSAYEEGEDAEHSPDLEEVIDLDDVLKALSEDDSDDEDDDDSEEVQAENAKLKSALGEHRQVVKYLKSKLNEVNLLNAKLLFTNKLFKSHNLNNDQKIKVVETFDRAKSLREVKLVFSTLAESFGYAGSINSKKAVYESASKAVSSTKPKKKVISEEASVANRFKKLAGLLKD